MKHEALSSLRAAHLVRTTGNELDDCVETYHDRIRENVIAEITPEEFAALHGRLGSVLEKSPRADAASVAEHFALAGQGERAGDWFAVAAREALETLAFERAAHMYQRVLELKPLSPREEGSIRRRLADAHANAGRGPEAALAYLGAARLAEHKDEKLDLAGIAARQYLHSGRFNEGARLTRDVLAEIGFKLPESRFCMLLLMLAARLWLRVRGLKFTAHDVSEVSPSELRLIDTFWSLTTGFAFIDPLQSRVMQTFGLLRALRCGETFRITRSIAMDAGHASVAGGSARRRVEVLLDRARDLSRNGGNAFLDGMLSLAEGIAACMQGRWTQAVSLCERAEKSLLGSSLTYELGVQKWGGVDAAQSITAIALFCSGQMEQLVIRMPEYLRIARWRGNQFALANLSMLNPTALAADEPDRAREELNAIMSQWTREIYCLQHLYAFLGRVQIELYSGQFGMAEQLVRENWRALGRSGLLRIQLFRVFSYYARSRCMLCAAEKTGKPISFLRQVERDATRIRRERQAWTQPLSDLLQAGASNLRGNAPQAATLLRAAVQGFDEADMPLYAAAARNRLGRLLGGEEGSRLRAAGNSWMTRQGIKNPSRMTAMVAPGFPD